VIRLSLPRSALQTETHLLSSHTSGPTRAADIPSALVRLSELQNQHPAAISFLIPSTSPHHHLPSILALPALSHFPSFPSLPTSHEHPPPPPLTNQTDYQLASKSSARLPRSPDISTSAVSRPKATAGARQYAVCSKSSQGYRGRQTPRRLQ
jgi:hypothetical protein